MQTEEIIETTAELLPIIGGFGGTITDAIAELRAHVDAIVELLDIASADDIRDDLIGAIVEALRVK
jgi:hypothetical protein